MHQVYGYLFEEDVQIYSEQKRILEEKGRDNEREVQILSGQSTRNPFLADAFSEIAAISSQGK